MIKVKILGVEIEADLLNPDVRKKYEDGLTFVAESSNNSLECKVTSDAIRMQCNSVVKCLDDVFGEGSAEKIVGKETNLLICLDAFEEYCGIYEKYVDPLVSARLSKAREKAGTSLVKEVKNV